MRWADVLRVLPERVGLTPGASTEGVLEVHDAVATPPAHRPTAILAAEKIDPHRILFPLLSGFHRTPVVRRLTTTYTVVPRVDGAYEERALADSGPVLLHDVWAPYAVHVHAAVVTHGGTADSVFVLPVLLPYGVAEGTQIIAARAVPDVEPAKRLFAPIEDVDAFAHGVRSDVRESLASAVYAAESVAAVCDRVAAFARTVAIVGDYARRRRRVVCWRSVRWVVDVGDWSAVIGRTMDLHDIWETVASGCDWTAAVGVVHVPWARAVPARGSA